MRKTLLTLAAATSALAVATPAAAQYYRAPQQGYGYNNSSAAFRNLQVRIDRLQQQIRDLDNRNLLTNGQARQRYNESRIIERQLYGMARDGFSPREADELTRGLAQFERQVWNDTNGGRGWGHEDNRYGYSEGRNWQNRDRQRDERSENDRWNDDD
jgi:hypothetical protein